MADSPPTDVGFARTRQNEACVYFLRDPNTNDIRYVGSTWHIRDRRQQHVTMKTATSPRLVAWFAELQSAGQAPVFEVFTVMHGHGALIAARLAEKHWIRYLARQQDGHLVLNEAHNPRRAKQRYWSRRPAEVSP